MKKFLFMILSAILLFAACAKIDVVSDRDLMNQDDMEIVFQSNVGHAPMTKAIIDTTKLPDGTEFGVYAYVNGTNEHYLINNGHYIVNKDTASAANGEKYYWPKSDNNNTPNIDFLAIYPYYNDANRYTRNNDIVTVKLKADTVGTESIDILYAVANDKNHQSVGTGNNTIPNKDYVNLTFRHILSLIEFTGKYVKDNNVDSVIVTKIEFLDNLGNAFNIITDGSLEFNMSSITKGTDSNNDPYIPTSFNGNTTKNTLNFGDSVILNTTYTEISRTIIIPQLIPDSVRITFDITIKNDNNSDKITFTNRQVTKCINNTNEKDMTLPIDSARQYITNWESGKRYIYKYYITVDDVEFAIDVDDWTVPNGWQIWDHDVTSYVDRFFDKASTMQAQNMVGIMA